MGNKDPEMFKKLKRKFIFNTIISSTVILLIAFSTVYMIAYNSSKRPRPKDDFRPEMSEDVSRMMDRQIESEREDHLRTLLISLIVTGVALEIVVAIFSILHAETSIRPVRDAYNAQKNFIANASHEIKTPLAIIQANIEAAGIENNKWIKNAAREAEDLAALNNQLLNLARMESGTDEIKLEKTNLKTVIEEVAEYYEPKLNKKGAKLKIISEKEIIKTLNLSGFKQLLNILIDNAVKYCDKRVVITLSEKSVTVKNDGATISEENLAHIFDRFYQTDKTKSGVGLGLAIGKSIAEYNKWSLVAESDKNSTTFSIRF